MKSGSILRKHLNREDVKESLAKVAATYEIPYADITEEEARKEYLKLKGFRWHELFTEGEWVPQ